MRRTELGLILFALAGLVVSIVWIATSMTGRPASKAAPAQAVSITRLTPLNAGIKRTTTGSDLVSLQSINPGPSYRIAGRIISKVNVDKKLIALTFDDGPSRNLEKILSTLTRYDAQATFFIVSSYIAKHGGWVQDIVTQGSEVGNHTETHIELDQASADQIARELDHSQEAIGQILGQKPTLMRPPAGKYDEAVVRAAKERRLAVVLWSLHSQDTGGDGARTLANRVIGSASPGDIVLMHETGAHSLEALPMILSALKAKGYKFVTVSQLLAAGNLP